MRALPKLCALTALLSALSLPITSLAKPAAVAVVTPAGEKLDESVREEVEVKLRDAVYLAARDDSELVVVVGAKAVGDDVREVRLACTEELPCREQTLAALQGKNIDYVIDVWIEAPVEGDLELTFVLIDLKTGAALRSIDEPVPAWTERNLERSTTKTTVDLVDGLLVRLRDAAGPSETEAQPVIQVIREPAPPAPPPELVPRSRMVPAGWAFVGAGSVSLVGGVVLLAINGNQAQCQFHPGVQDCVPIDYITAVPGAVLAGLGAASIIVGGTLVGLGKRRDKRALEDVSVAVGSRFVGVRGRF